MRIINLLLCLILLNFIQAQEISPGKCTLTIQVTDFDSIPEANAKMIIWNEADSLSFSKEIITDLDGKRVIDIDQGQDYNLKIFKSDTSFVFKDYIKIPVYENDFTARVAFQIKTFKVYSEIRELDVHFDSNSSEIKINDIEELDELYDWLSNNSLTTIELASHTDDVGRDESNLRLSQRRSNSVMKYLVDKGIDKNRIAAKGYGEKEPKESNETDKGRASNRRTEVRITVKK